MPDEKWTGRKSISKVMPIKRSSLSMKPQKLILIIGSLLAVAVLTSFLLLRRYVASPVLNIPEGKSELLFIPTGADYDDVKLLLNSKNLLADEQAFDVIASLLSYPANVRSGCYELRHNLSAKSLVSLLRSGCQKPVNVTFNNVRSVEALAGLVAKYVETDSVSLLRAMTDPDALAQWDLKPADAPAIFLPDSYQVWWDASPEAFVQRMHKEYTRFWNDARKHKADSLALTPLQVSILASIVEEESNNAGDQRKIASVYLNRLRIRMPLQACPTVKYAIGDFTIRRVTNADAQVQSPYNTYLHQGLPPGPIRITSKRVIDAVLNADDTDYLYFCARPDGSGLHDFARTLAQHQRNANKYHKALNQRKIFR